MRISFLVIAVLLTSCASSEPETPVVTSYQECEQAGGKVLYKQPHECTIFEETFYDNSPTAKFMDYGPATGYYASPVSGGPYPAVVLVHGQMGLQHDIWAQARGLAKEGKVVLAVDLYDGQKPRDTEEAVALEAAVKADLDTAFANIEEAAKWVSLQYNVTEDPVRFLGSSFGEEWDRRLATLEE